MSTVVWSTPAMCMVPTADTARESKYVTTAGRIKFRVGQSGVISFIGPVQIPLPEGRYVLRAHLERTIPDLFRTSIELRRAGRFDGGVETLLNCVGVEGGDVPNNVRFADSPGQQLKIDLDQHYYWVQVDNANEIPATPDTVDAVLGVGLILE